MEGMPPENADAVWSELPGEGLLLVSPISSGSGGSDDGIDSTYCY